jgi:hypothetical protein
MERGKKRPHKASGKSFGRASIIGRDVDHDTVNRGTRKQIHRSILMPWMDDYPGTASSENNALQALSKMYLSSSSKP